MIIVTGGAGFIGSNLIHGLNERGYTDILVVDHLKNGQKHLNLNALRFADYVDRDDLFDAIREESSIEAIFHQGACSDTTERDGRYMMKNNYEYSKRLLDFAELRGCKFIYASSAAVYGGGDRGFREEPACEWPLNVYGYSKLAFDNFVRRRRERSQAQVVGLRYFNVYGPNERHKGRMASVAMHLFDQLSVGAAMKLFEGSEGFRRDFIHVDDVVAVNLAFLSAKTSGIFNCGSGQARSFVDIARTLQRLKGGGELEFTPFPADLRGKYQAFTEADLGQLRSSGIDHEMCTLERGLESYYRVLSQSGGIRR